MIVSTVSLKRKDRTKWDDERSNSQKNPLKTANERRNKNNYNKKL